METVKIEDKKYGDVVAEIYHKSVWVKHEDGTKIEMSATQALQLASALTERYGGGEWKPICNAPEGEVVWVKSESGLVGKGRRQGSTIADVDLGEIYEPITHYQPITKPAP